MRILTELEFILYSIVTVLYCILTFNSINLPTYTDTTEM